MDRTLCALMLNIGFLLLLISIPFYYNYKDSSAKIEKLKREESDASPELRLDSETLMNSKKRAMAMQNQQFRQRWNLIVVVCFSISGVVLVFTYICSCLFCLEEDSRGGSFRLHRISAARIQHRRPAVCEDDREVILRANNMEPPQPQVFRRAPIAVEVAADLPGVPS